MREIRDAPFAKTLLRRMEDAGFVPNHTRAKPGEGLPNRRDARRTPGSETVRQGATSYEASGTKHPTVLAHGHPRPRLAHAFRGVSVQLALARARATPAHRRRRRGPVRLCSRPSRRDAARETRGHRPDAAADAVCGGRGAGARGHVLVHAALRAALYENVLRANGGGDDGADGHRRRRPRRESVLAERANRLRFREPVRDVRAPVGRPRGARECPRRVLEAAERRAGRVGNKGGPGGTAAAAARSARSTTRACRRGGFEFCF